MGVSLNGVPQGGSFAGSHADAFDTAAVAVNASAVGIAFNAASVYITIDSAAVAHTSIVHSAVLCSAVVYSTVVYTAVVCAAGLYAAYDPAAGVIPAAAVIRAA